MGGALQSRAPRAARAFARGRASRQQPAAAMARVHQPQCRQRARPARRLRNDPRGGQGQAADHAGRRLARQQLPRHRRSAARHSHAAAATLFRTACRGSTPAISPDCRACTASRGRSSRIPTAASIPSSCCVSCSPTRRCSRSSLPSCGRCRRCCASSWSKTPAGSPRASSRRCAGASRPTAMPTRCSALRPASSTTCRRCEAGTGTGWSRAFTVQLFQRLRHGDAAAAGALQELSQRLADGRHERRSGRADGDRAPGRRRSFGAQPHHQHAARHRLRVARLRRSGEPRASGALPQCGVCRRWISSRAIVTAAPSRTSRAARRTRRSTSRMPRSPRLPTASGRRSATERSRLLAHQRRTAAVRARARLPAVARRSASCHGMPNTRCPCISAWWLVVTAGMVALLRDARQRRRCAPRRAVALCAARDRAVPRSRAHPRQPVRDRSRRAAAHAALRDAGGARCVDAHVRRRADDARRRHADRRAGAHARNALPVERRQRRRDVLRAADRLARCAGRARRRRRAPAAARRRTRFMRSTSATVQPRSGDRLFYLFHRRRLWNRGAGTRGWAGSASAASCTNSTGCCAARPIRRS